MKLIPLSKNGTKYKGKYFAKVDDEDYEYLNQWDWKVAINSYFGCYAVRKVEKNKVKTLIRMHNIVMKINDSSLCADHIDHDGLNNQKNNLRIATRSENSRYRRKIKMGSSKFIGVCSIPKKKGEEHVRRRKTERKIWRSFIFINKKQVLLGHFTTEEEAARVRDSNAIKYFGQFAKLNFPINC